ncbi:MAG TPA: hypothetical protein VMU34_26675 [Mycobacterium sp.]|nr:hypothetical protein [Mycobacterium sp.]
MPQWRDFLDRFRPAGTPGTPGRPAVPANRSVDAAAELTAVLVLLDDAQQEALRIREAGAERAEEIRRDADRKAAEIIANARREADTVRLEAGMQALREAEAAADDMRASTVAEITRLRAQAGERLPNYVDVVASRARQWLDGLGQSSATVGSDR